MKLLLFLAVWCAMTLRAQELKDSVNQNMGARRSLGSGLMTKTLSGGAAGIGSAVVIGLPAAIILTEKNRSALKMVAVSYVIGTAWGVVNAGKPDNGDFILTIAGATAGLYTGLYLSRTVGADKHKKWVLFDFSPPRLIPYLTTPLFAALCYNLSRKPDSATVSPLVDPHSKTIGIAVSNRF